ncbi:Hypothetical predicted protein [Podarcis lilfordi]|uniref:Uncharacterized protein n=1 Tax=Podarcis lilfordi TaxID=74358 RepID=A0AA35KA59_9SAUR|nr:Hypothetical predicted protein [Podarcis lilfordi]
MAVARGNRAAAEGGFVQQNKTKQKERKQARKRPLRAVLSLFLISGQENMLNDQESFHLWTGVIQLSWCAKEGLMPLTFGVKKVARGHLPQGHASSSKCRHK